MDELDKVMATTAAAGQGIKNKLDKIKQEDDVFKAKKENLNSATTQMRLNMYQVRYFRLIYPCTVDAHVPWHHPPARRTCGGFIR